MIKRKKLSIVGWASLMTLILCVPASLTAWNRYLHSRISHADRVYDSSLLKTNDILYVTCRYDCMSTTNALGIFPLLPWSDIPDDCVSFGFENAPLITVMNVFTKWLPFDAGLMTSVSEEELSGITISVNIQQLHQGTAWMLVAREAGYYGAINEQQLRYFIEKSPQALNSALLDFDNIVSNKFLE
jgi:hypothetical protein